MLRLFAYGYLFFAVYGLLSSSQEPAAKVLGLGVIGIFFGVFFYYFLDERVSDAEGWAVRVLFVASVFVMFGGLAFIGPIEDSPPSAREELRRQWSAELAGCYADRECGAWLGSVESNERGPETDRTCGLDTECDAFRSWYDDVFQDR